MISYYKIIGLLMRGNPIIYGKIYIYNLQQKLIKYYQNQINKQIVIVINLYKRN